MTEKIMDQIEELFENKDYASLRRIMEDEEPADVAAVLNEVRTEEALLLFRIIPKDLAAETFVEMDSDLQRSFIEKFSDREITEMLDEMFVDDTVDIIEEMPANVVRRILANSSPETRSQINQILKYPKDSAGSIMTTEFVELRPHTTVEEAFERIRVTGLDKETIYTCYVTDDSRELIGVVTVKDMILGGNGVEVGDIMETSIISADTHMDKEEVVKLLDKYDFLALPVVDTEGRLVGIITFDDAMDVMREEDTEDMEKMAAITPTEKPYLRTGIFETFFSRVPWLLLLMVSATLSSNILLHYESALAVQAALTAYIPMIMGTGGNAGSQASVTIIRGLSLGDIEMRDIIRVIWKEIRVSVLCGITLAAVNFGKMMIFDGVGVLVAAAVSVTLVLTVIIAKVAGCSLPIIVKRIGLDPAVMASPFITTIVDCISLLVYVNAAGLMLS
ncbi:MAG: magnesium transporter [Ruminococcaceae bacterium]|nr:magnesium transporter [Oscillospiraceae bacterium]